MSSIGPLWLGPTFIVAAAELSLHSARVAQLDPRAPAGGTVPAGKVNQHKASKCSFKGQECGA